MSRTHKRQETRKCFRSPKGARAALRAGVRTRKVPPSDYDDKDLDPQCFECYRVCENLLAAGYSKADVVYKISDRYKMSLREASSVVASRSRWFEWCGGTTSTKPFYE